MRTGAILAVVASLLAAAGLEGAVRLAVWSGLPFFRRPGLYALETDDDYWKLAHAWGGPGTMPAAGVFDRELGWAPAPAGADPIGVADAACFTPPTPPTAVFYGDSFMAGAVPCPSAVPGLVATRLPGMSVLNLGVGGYGVDQILLRLRRTLPALSPAAVVVGILTVDLDRSLLTVRTAPKPYFTLGSDDRLVLHGVPLPADRDAWYARHPPQIASYLLAMLRVRWQWLRAHGVWMDAGARVDEITRLGTPIVTAIVETVRRAGVPLVVAVFYAQDELDRPSWRGNLLLRLLSGLGVSAVDGKTALLADATRTGRDVRSYYLPDGHLNADGNGVLAAQVARALAQAVPAAGR